MKGRTFLLEFGFFATILGIYVGGYIYSVEHDKELRAGYDQSREAFGWEEGSYEWVTLGVNFGQTAEEVDARMEAIGKRTDNFLILRDMKEKGVPFEGFIHSYMFEHHIKPEIEGFVHEDYSVWFNEEGRATRMQRGLFGPGGYFKAVEDFCDIDLWTGEITPTVGAVTMVSAVLDPSADQPMQCGGK